MWKDTLKRPSVAFSAVSIVSLGVGIAGGYLLAKKRLETTIETKYQELSAHEISEARKFYAARRASGIHIPSPEEVLKALHPEVEIEDERYSDEAFEAIKNYQGIGEEEVEDILSAAENLTSDDESDTEEEVVYNIFDREDEELIYEGFDYEKEIPLRTKNKPYVITQEEFYQNETGYEQTSATYFEGDDVLVDEQDKPIPDIEKTVSSDALSKFGLGSTDPNIVHVRNERLSLDFEVSRSTGKYTEEVLGFLQHEDDRRPRKFRGYDE